MMKISIIVPVYNVEEYIIDLLESVSNQDIDKSEYEVIFIDDGSPDHSGEIIQKYAKDNPNFIYHRKENGGVSSARNTGLDLAKGEYVWFVDGDDFITHNCLKEIVEALEEYSPDQLQVKPIAFKHGIDLTHHKSGDISEDESIRIYKSYLWTRLIRRDILLKNGVRFELGITYCEDHYFNAVLSVYLKKQHHLSGRIIYHYRIRSNSLSELPIETKIENNIAVCKGYKKIADESVSEPPPAVMQGLYNIMAYIMSEIAKMSYHKANKYLRMLKENNLYPLKYNKIYSAKLKSRASDRDNIILNKLKTISFTRFGYHLLRSFRFYLRCKRKILRMITKHE